MSMNFSAWIHISWHAHLPISLMYAYMHTNLNIHKTPHLVQTNQARLTLHCQTPTDPRWVTISVLGHVHNTRRHMTPIRKYFRVLMIVDDCSRYRSIYELANERSFQYRPRRGMLGANTVNNTFKPSFKCAVLCTC